MGPRFDGTPAGGSVFGVMPERRSDQSRAKFAPDLFEAGVASLYPFRIVAVDPEEDKIDRDVHVVHVAPTSDLRTDDVESALREIPRRAQRQASRPPVRR